MSEGRFVGAGRCFLLRGCDRVVAGDSLSGAAPGYRYHTSGIAVVIGNSGFGWSSTIGINGLALNFHSQSLNASHSGYRTYGFQLRCLSE